MNIDKELLEMGIISNSSVELDIEELLASAVIYEDDFIKVSTNILTMIFSKDYELLEAYGEVVTQKPTLDDCEVS